MSPLLESELSTEQRIDACTDDYIKTRDAHPYHVQRRAAAVGTHAANIRAAEEEGDRTMHARATRNVAAAINAVANLADWGMDVSTVLPLLEDAAANLTKCYAPEF